MMKMNNKCIGLLLIGMLISVSSYAQTPYSGIKGGVNFSNLFIDDVDDENMRVGFHAGVYTQFLGPMGTVGFQPELLFSTKGAKANYNLVGNTGEVKFNLNYIDLPLLAVFKLGEDAEIHLGPYVSYLVSASVSTEGDFGDGQDDLDRDHFKSFDYGLAGGLGLNFYPVSIGVRYNYGLQQVADSDAAEFFLDNSKNGNGQVFVAFNMR